MQPDSFMLTPSVEKRREQLTALIQEINPELQEVTSMSNNTMVIASPSEVFLHFGSRKYYVTPSFIEDVAKMKLNIFPLTEERKQVVSLCLAPLSISTVGYDTKAAAVICKYILLLGGTYSRNMNDTVTLLIARIPLSKKIDEARRIGIPIVTIEWIKNCYTQLKLVEFEEYQFSLFENCSFTSTDLTSRTQKELRGIVEDNGGIWKDRLDDSIDIVVASSLTMTKKIKLALSASIPIVKPKWLYDSVALKGKELSKEYVLNWWSYNEEKTDLFKDITFSCSDEALSNAIKSHSGTLVAQNKAQYIVVHLNEQNVSAENVVTDKWVWRCIETQSIIDITTSVLFKPLSYSVPVPDFIGYIVSVLNFPEEQRAEISDAIRILGGVPMSRMHKSSKLAIVYNMTDKVKAAQKKYENTHFISMQFIKDFLSNGKMPDPNNYTFENIKKNKISSLCNFLTSIKDDKYQLKSSSITPYKCESFTSDGSDIEADVIYESRPTMYKDHIGRSSYDPLMSALSSSGY